MRFLLYSIILLSTLWIEAQNRIEGLVVDENREGLPFATLYLDGSTIGTTTNANGRFSLKAPVGKHVLVVQFVGYQKKRVPIEVGGGFADPLMIRLEPETIQLNAVVVNSDGEDPAYRVIREAIAMRKFHQREVEAYSCDVYIKGVQRLEEKPDKFFGVNIDIDTGIVYLSESISKFRFELPDKIDENMISSKVSGNNNAFSWNQASDFLVDFYQNKFEYPGLSERGFVSPIAGNAFLFYEYEHLGIFYEDDRMINKIKVIPKRESDPVFSGEIYIVEDSWRIHTTDLFLTKNRGIEFVDSIRIQQVFAPTEFGIFLPLTQDFSFQFKVFAFKGRGNFVSVYSNYDVQPNYEVFREYGKYQERFGEKKEEKDLFQKDDFDNTIMTVEEKANERDSIYWQEVRPIPLSPVEIKDYKVKDSIRIIKESEPYRDSIDRENNKFNVTQALLVGYNYRNSFKGNYITLPGLLGLLNYNTVEGLAPYGRFAFSKRNPKKDELKYTITSTVRYGVGNRRFHAKGSFTLPLDERTNKRIRVSGGRYISQYNAAEPIGETINSYFTVFSGQNFMKIYQKNFFEASYSQEVVDGMSLSTQISFENRDQLQNTADFTFADEGEAQFTSNIPVVDELSDASFDQHQALTWSAIITYQPGRKYIDRPDMRINLGSKYPTFSVRYKKGLPLGAADIDYDLISGRVTDDMRLGLVGTFSYLFEAGIFLNNQNMELPDFKHFNGNLTYLGNFGISNFQTLDYYRFSTQDQYIEAHAEHHFNEFILNKIPLIRKLNWQTVISMHSLLTPTAGNYTEFGVGIEHIFKFFRVDYYRGYHRGQLSNVGIRVGAGF
jgi:hypothetical protein